jgi:hypothetical protein
MTRHEKTPAAFAAAADFTADKFSSTQWEEAEAKAQFAQAFIRFVESDFAKSDFTEPFYKRLSMTFDHIAHYDREGFYATFFTAAEDKVRFLQQTARHCCHGDPAYTYSDVERALQSWLKENSVLAKHQERLDDMRSPKLTQVQWDALPDDRKGTIGGKPYRLSQDEKSGVAVLAPVRIVADKEPAISPDPHAYIEKQLTSSAMFHTPGFFRALQNDYPIDDESRDRAIKLLSQAYHLPPKEAEGLLSGSIKAEIDDSAGVITYTIPKPIDEYQPRHVSGKETSASRTAGLSAALFGGADPPKESRETQKDSPHHERDGRSR